MTLTFADTHNMIAYLIKSNASEGFNQINNFLNRSSIKYALTVNLNIYVSCIKQFWTTVAVKMVNDVTRLQALVDKKKVVITEASIKDALRLDDAEGVECLPNEEFFAELARMGYKKPSTKLTFYKAYFSSQKQVGDLLTHTIKYTSPALTQKVFANMRRVGKGFSRVETPLFEGMIEEQHVDKGGILVNIDADEDVVLEDAADVAVEKSVDVEESAHDQRRKAESQEEIYKIDLEHANKVLSMQEEESEPTELQEVVDVVTTAKMITKVVTAASDTIIVASTNITNVDVQVPAATFTAAPSRLTVAPRRRKGVVIRDPKESTTSSTIIPAEAKSKDKGKGILVEEPKPLKSKLKLNKMKLLLGS
uniref:Xylulose kinase-1 n=1 Tax=Tanacetum cinerariifolium TaxID=118510 RepID=A0A699K1G6_TANCI|nr:hypothetical protein [Tanacetum cinerariifolium]